MGNGEDVIKRTEMRSFHFGIKLRLNIHEEY